LTVATDVSDQTFVSASTVGLADIVRVLWSRSTGTLAVSSTGSRTDGAATRMRQTRVRFAVVVWDQSLRLDDKRND